MTDHLLLDVTGERSRLLTANQRLHYKQRGERTAYWRTRAATLVVPRFATARIVLTFAWPDKRRRDVANLYPTAKAIVDGLVDAGLLPDDNDNHLTGPDLRRGYGPWSITVQVEGERA